MCCFKWDLLKLSITTIGVTRHPGLGLRTHVSFGNKEIRAELMGDIITHQLRMTVDEFRDAMDGDIPERFTNPEFWND